MSTLATESILVEVLPEFGARLHRLSVFGHDLLRTPDDALEHRRDPFLWGSYVMAPWCNRIDPGATAVGGAVIDVPSNSPDGTALHGQVYLIPWEEREAGTFSVRGGGDGWPWPFETTARFRPAELGVGRATLDSELVLTNLGDRPMPGGIGFHPWFRGPIEVGIAADHVLPSNLRADDPVEAVSGDFDLQTTRVMPIGLDATWLDPDRPQVRLRWPHLGMGATLEAWSDTDLCIVAASPAGAGAVAVEPETHAPHGLRRLLAGTPHGLAWVAPGESIRLTTRLTFEQST